MNTGRIEELLGYVLQPLETIMRNAERIADGLDRRNALLEESNAMARTNAQAIVEASQRLEAKDAGRFLPEGWSYSVADDFGIVLTRPDGSLYAVAGKAA